MEIIKTLASGSQGISIIARAIGLSRQSTVDRLRNLRSLGFIRQTGEGAKTVYELTKQVK